MRTTCALCLKPAILEDSHILPEFVYRPIYEDGKAVELDIGGGTQGTRRRGYTEPLLCRDCESRFSALESDFANAWHNPAKRIRPSQISVGRLVIPGFDYSRFKLFHMSLLWRMAVSTKPPFQNVWLGPRKEVLRRMLLTSDPGEPDDFALFGIGLRDPETGSWQDEIMHAPQGARLHSQWVYTVLFYGVRWHYFASKHLAGRGIPAVFTRTGDLPLVIRDWTDDPYLKQAAPSVATLKPRTRR